MKKLNSLTRGLVVFLILAVLTAIEYYLGISEVPQILLWIIALTKMTLVLNYFMHFYRVLGNDEGEHE
jgi:heme/copper-type cytochrome/quinol oxidase subunit 4